MMQKFFFWGLHEMYMMIMLSDGGSNMMKAGKDWKIKHSAYLGHSLHLVVGPFLAAKKNEAEGIETEGDEGDDPGKVDAFVDEYNKDFAKHAHVQHGNNAMMHLRKIYAPT
jgi:hypothetical protein